MSVAMKVVQVENREKVSLVVIQMDAIQNK